MASQSNVYTADDVRDEIFADIDSDFDANSDDSDTYEPSSSEESVGAENSEEDSETLGVQSDVEPSSSRGNLHQDNFDNGDNETFRDLHEASQNNRGSRRGRGRGRGRGMTNQERAKQKQLLLEAKWKAVDQPPKIPDFTATPGIQVELPDDAGEVDFMNLFFTDEVFDLLVTETNLYASQYIRDHPNLPAHSQARSWYDTTREEMKKFIALSLLMGIVQKPAISDYWSTNPLLKGSVFNSVMPRNRYQTILRFLHFADNSQYDANDPDRDRLYKVRAIIDLLVSKFKAAYTPEKNISIDEELLLWKGRLIFKQYIPLKRARFGIKIFSLCETSGYLWNSYVYLGKEPDAHTANQQLVKRLGKSGAVVPRLMETLLGKGYHVYVDNWYTSEELVTYLYENKTAACGTAKKNRLQLPKSFKSSNLKKGEHSFRRNGNILAIRFNDKKEIYFLSTIHTANVVDTRKRDRQGNVVKKLKVVDDYNKNMGGVDRNDGMIGTYSAVRKSMKWTKKVVFHFLEEGLLNAFILYKKKGGKKALLRFKMDCITGLLSSAEVAAPDASNRLSGRHFPELIPPTASKEKPQKRCVICTKDKKRKESRYQCADCENKPGLCAAPCFMKYHTVL